MYPYLLRLKVKKCLRKLHNNKEKRKSYIFSCKFKVGDCRRVEDKGGNSPNYCTNKSTRKSSTIYLNKTRQTFIGQNVAVAFQNKISTYLKI